jgi:hypothetical protein
MQCLFTGVQHVRKQPLQAKPQHQHQRTQAEVTNTAPGRPTQILLRGKGHSCLEPALATHGQRMQRALSLQTYRLGQEWEKHPVSCRLSNQANKKLPHVHIVQVNAAFSTSREEEEAKS